MGLAFPFSREARLVFSLTLLLVLGFCYCYDKSVEVNGDVECTDSRLKNVESSHVLSGYRVAISCKVEDGKLQTKGVGEIKEGKFKVALPTDMVDDEGHLKDECFAQFLTASNTPCTSSIDLEASKIVYKSSDNGKHMLGVKGKLEFSPTVCTSAFKYFFKHPLKKKPLKKKPFLPPILKKPDFPPLPKKPIFPPKDSPLDQVEPFPSVSNFPPVFGELAHETTETDPLMDDNHFLHHKKHFPPLHKFKPIPKVPIVHKKPLPPLHKFKPIPKIPDHP